MSEKEIDELEKFFNSVKVPTEIQLNRGIKLLNAPQNIKDNLNYLRTMPQGLYTTAPRLEALLQIKRFLSPQQE